VLAEIVDTALALLGESDTTRRVEVDVSEDLPLVSVDAVLVQQVFKNLISNSLKYAPPDTAIQVTARRSPEEEGLLVTVRNQGPHVAEEHLEDIFDKFHRVTETDRIPGMGLGLSICKGIVEAHGGRIWAANLPDGFAFHFVLPLTPKGVPAPRLSGREIHDE
jgi:two-component system sensor histidine kinase KdpD